MPKAVKTGVKLGGGPPPGFKWNCDYLAQARREAASFLDPTQYHHVADQFKLLAEQDDPTHSEAVDVRKFATEANLYELRDKWGPLGRINLRVFFGVYKASKTIVVFGALNKTNDGKTPMSDIVRMRRRQREFEKRFHQKE